jgi:hypothetical protein
MKERALLSKESNRTLQKMSGMGGESPNMQSSNPSSSGGESPGGTATLSATKEKVTGAVRETAAELKQSASATFSRAKEEAGRLASEKKTETAERIGNYGAAIHSSAKSLEEKDPNIAWLTHRAAERLESVADYVRNRDFGALRSDAEDFARRHPVAFFGGLFLAGLVLGNVLKASTSTQNGSTAASDDERYRSEGDSGASSYAQNDPRTASDLGLYPEGAS